MSDMYITQAVGSRNYSLHWRDGHGTWAGNHSGGIPAHPTVLGYMVGNHSTMPAPNTPHFNWGIDFPGTVTASNYSTWATKGKGPDCTWITFCTSCCPPPGTGPDCCCVSNGSAATGGASDMVLKAAHPPDAPQPRIVHWCKHPYCPYKPPPPPPPSPPPPAPPGMPNCSSVAKGPVCKCGPNPKTGGPGGGYPGVGFCWNCESCGTCASCGTCKLCADTGTPPLVLRMGIN